MFDEDLKRKFVAISIYEYKNSDWLGEIGAISLFKKKKLIT